MDRTFMCDVSLLLLFFFCLSTTKRPIIFDRVASIGNSNTQQSAIPPTIDEESSNAPTGNGDAIHHAPMLQVDIALIRLFDITCDTRHRAMEEKHTHTHIYTSYDKNFARNVAMDCVILLLVWLNGCHRHPFLFEFQILFIFLLLLPPTFCIDLFRMCF